MPNSKAKVSVLAFEVANTIIKGSELLQSLSHENIQVLKDEILHSEAVQQLVSTNTKELLNIAASDKRAEFVEFLREVCRFGDLCIDPQWHNLSRYMSILGLDSHIANEKDLALQELLTLSGYTSKLYHELRALDRSEQNYRRKIMELESSQLPRRGKGLSKLHSELKHQRKLVKSLKNRSLWSKSLEEVVEKLLDIVIFTDKRILQVFGDNGLSPTEKKPSDKPERLGIRGLDLHYAHIITQINNLFFFRKRVLASCPTFPHPYMRDKLYNDLPVNVKGKLRSLLLLRGDREDLSILLMKPYEMERTLEWLVPFAMETIKAHQNFGWVGEWAYTSMFSETPTNNSVIRLQTLHHAIKENMDQYILELVIGLHQLVSVRSKIER